MNDKETIRDNMAVSDIDHSFAAAADEGIRVIDADYCGCRQD